MTENQISVSAHFHQEVTKHHFGQYSAAIVDYNTAIWFKPNSAETYSNR
jgi:hypothetical protein